MCYHTSQTKNIKDIQTAFGLPVRNEELFQQAYQLNLFEADPKFKEMAELLKAVDINTISPVEALLKLNELKAIMKD